MKKQRAAVLSLLLACTALDVAHAQDTSLVGLWFAKRWFGPEVRGELIVQRTGDRWRASIGARTAEFRVARDSVSFDLPAAAAFKGRMARNSSAIVGQWIEPQRRLAMPLTLTSCGTDCYTARVQPLDDEFTFYMEVKRRPDGKLGAFLRNPERNQGRFIRLDHLVRRGDTVLLRNARDSTIERALLRFGRLSVMLRFATYDFQKIPADSFTHFYPRGWRTGTYTYAPPRARNDGWAVARARGRHVGGKAGDDGANARQQLRGQRERLSSAWHSRRATWQARARGIFPRRARRQAARYAFCVQDARQRRARSGDAGRDEGGSRHAGLRDDGARFPNTRSAQARHDAASSADDELGPRLRRWLA